MKTQYRHIHFVSNPDFWECHNNQGDDVLGGVGFYEEWKQFIFVPTMDFETIHSASCLRDIADFLEQLNATRLGE